MIRLLGRCCRYNLFVVFMNKTCAFFFLRGFNFTSSSNLYYSLSIPTPNYNVDCGLSKQLHYPDYSHFPVSRPSLPLQSPTSPKLNSSNVYRLISGLASRGVSRGERLWPCRFLLGTGRGGLDDVEFVLITFGSLLVNVFSIRFPPLHILAFARPLFLSPQQQSPHTTSPHYSTY